jgi:DNA-binding GntR family transcriptional regulator
MKISARQLAYNYLWDRLVRGECAPGDPVIAQDICRALGASNTPVREALFQLCAEGILVRTSRREMIVAIPKRREIIQLLEVRAALERHAATKGVRRITTAKLHDLHRLIDALQRIVAMVETDRDMIPLATQCWSAVDLMLHRIMIRSGDNVETLKVIERGIIRMLGLSDGRKYGEMQWLDVVARLQQDFKVHSDMVSAFSKRDPKAAREAIRAHALRARRNLLDRLDWLARRQSLPAKPPIEYPEWLRTLLQEINQNSQLEDNLAEQAGLPLDVRIERIWRIESEEGAASSRPAIHPPVAPPQSERCDR